MIVAFLRWLGRNLSTLLIAFVLAVVVWVSSVTSADPDQEAVFPRPVTLEILGKSDSLLIVNDVPDTVRVTLRAPASVWSQLSSRVDSVNASINLDGLGPGEHTVPVEVELNARPVRITQKDPAEVKVVLEPLVSMVYTITVEVNGEPMTGYTAGQVTYSPTEVEISGPQSQVTRVVEVLATLDIAQSTQSIVTDLPLVALDASGEPVQGLTLTPPQVNLRQPVDIAGGYRNAIVKVVTVGQVASGYKLTNIQPSPPNVIVFSAVPRLLEELPGYVETEPLDLTGLEDDTEIFLDLNLPAGITAVNNQRVLVQISVAAIESNLTMSVPVEVIGLAPGLASRVEPATVDIILSGPLPVLNTLRPDDLQVIVDLTEFSEGIHRLSPNVDVLPERVLIESVLPALVDVTIFIAPTPTVTPTFAPIFTPTPTPGTGAE